MLCGVAGTLRVTSSNQVAKIEGNQVAVAGAFGEFKVPVQPSPRLALKQKVLDEDTYTNSLQRIVERDFFPELPYLRAKQELEDAINTRDPMRIRDAHANLRRVAATPAGRRLNTPGRPGTGSRMNTGTRAGTGRFSEPGTPASHLDGSGERGRDMMMEDSGAYSKDTIGDLVEGKTLDSFVRTYTSEDNYAASELMLKDAVRLEQQRSWVHEQAAEYNMRQKLLITNGPKQEDATLNMLLSAPYDEKQSLCHMVPSTEHQHKESALQRSRAPKSICLSATRVDKSLVNALETTAKAAQESSKRPPTDAVGESPRVGGFGFVCTPSPAPGVDDEPLFTWGLMEGTPLLLPEDNMPGYQPFKVQEPTAKEITANKLWAKSSISMKRHAHGVSDPGIKKSIISRPGTPGTPRLSEAALKLAAKKQSGLGAAAFDLQLRSTYRGTPSTSRGVTPKHTPKHTPRASVAPSPAASRGRASSPPRSSGGGSDATTTSQSAANTSASGKHLTDGLLQL